MLSWFADQWIYYSKIYINIYAYLYNNSSKKKKIPTRGKFNIFKNKINIYKSLKYYEIKMAKTRQGANRAACAWL